MLVNAMENIVDVRLSDFMNNADFCTCEQCVEDIKCIALNNLPPKYVSTSKGELFSRLDQVMIKQHAVDVNIAIINAIEFVKAHPKHK